MIKIFELIISAFFGDRCPYCGRTVPSGKLYCKNCGTLFPKEYRKNRVVGGYRCVAPFRYEGVFRKAVNNFKFYSRPEYDKGLAAQICKCVKAEYGDEIDLITFVPMRRAKQIKRGYNQAELLARQMSKILSIPCRRQLIQHKKNKTQHELSSLERKANVKGVYKAVETERIKGKTVLVVDDISTTGCTLGECCKVLEKAGAKKLYCASVCGR